MTDTVRRTSPREPMGSLGLPLYSGYLRLDPNASLRLYGAEAIRQYRRMLYEEPAATAFYHACLTLLRTDAQAEPGGETDADKAAAEHLQACLDDIEGGVSAAIRQMYGMIWAGWDIHETTLKRRDDGTIGWRAWELRRQETLERWLTAPDDAGRVVGMVQRPPPSYRVVAIPQERYIHVVSDDSEGSPEGRSAFRGMYRAWYMARNLEMMWGVGLERFGTGLPVFETDAPLTTEDSKILQAIGEGLRQNEEAFLVLPPGVKFRFAPSPGLSSNDYRNAIQYLRLVMLSTVLADFIGLGTQSGGGAYALGRDKSELFLLALNGYQQRITDAISAQAVRRLYRYPANRVNRFGAITSPPRVTIPALKRYDLGQLGAFVTTLDRLGGFTMRPEDEAFFRKVGDLLDFQPEEVARRSDAPPPPPQGDPAAGDEQPRTDDADRDEGDAERVAETDADEDVEERDDVGAEDVEEDEDGD